MQHLVFKVVPHANNAKTYITNIHKTHCSSPSTAPHTRHPPPTTSHALQKNTFKSTVADRQSNVLKTKSMRSQTWDVNCHHHSCPRALCHLSGVAPALALKNVLIPVTFTLKEQPQPQERLGHLHKRPLEGDKSLHKQMPSASKTEHVSD